VPIQKLTKRVVDAISPAEKTVVYYDSELTGFCLKVLPTGGKRWCVEYRSGAGGRSVGKTRMVLGSTSAMTPDQARQSARTILGAVALGQDPAGKRSRERAMPTFAEFAERYLTEEAETKLKPGTVVNYRIYLRKHASPVIGTRKLDALETADIAKMHRKIGKTTPMTANRVVEFVGSVFRYAAVCSLIPRGHNPAGHVQGFREERRERFLSSAELGRLGDAIREAETTGIPWKVDKDQPNAKHIPKNGRLSCRWPVRFSSFHRIKAGDLQVRIDAGCETQVAQSKVDEDVNGRYTKEPNRARTSFRSPGLRAMAGWHDGFGVRDLAGSGCQLLHCVHT
jgi:Arm DNA-binding domain/Phage integrase, N-terminal SAM-like domain